jgi:hypothetical protein
VNAGASGRVAVYAEADVSVTNLGVGTASNPFVYLHEAGFPGNGCRQIITGSPNSSPIIMSTLPGSAIGTGGFGSWMIVGTTPGPHTFSLRYGWSGAGDPTEPHIEISHRGLWIQPL